jgi:hypothetical protein
MADIIDSFIRACGKQMADAIQTQSSPWPQNGFSFFETQLSEDIKIM